jgi:hypothetical protein
MSNSAVTIELTLTELQALVSGLQTLTTALSAAFCPERPAPILSLVSLDDRKEPEC